jgi:hypothetical protein
MTDLFNYAEAVRRRDTAIAGLEADSLLWRGDWVGKARFMAIQHAMIHGTVSSDDVHRICPMPMNESRNAMGAVFRTQNLQLVDFKQSERVSAHARRIGVYKFVGSR